MANSNSRLWPAIPTAAYAMSPALALYEANDSAMARPSAIVVLVKIHDIWATPR